MTAKYPNASPRERFDRVSLDNKIQEEARIANDLQREFPEIPRGEALRIAAGKPQSAPAPVSYAPEVIADNSGQFCGNGLRFATREEAEANVSNLMMRWMAVRETRVVESTDPVNYRYVDGKLEVVKEKVEAFFAEHPEIAAANAIAKSERT